MKKLIVKRVGLFSNLLIRTTRLEGVELIGYWKKADSFVIKHPAKEIYWCVSRKFIKELAEYKD